jgi:hypothetical protein
VFFIHVFLYKGFRTLHDSIIGTVARLQAGQSGVRIPANGKNSVIYTELYTPSLLKGFDDVV